MRVLLATNVIISAILFGGVPRQILEATLTGDIDLITSPLLLAETERVLREKFGFPSTMAASIRSELEAIGEVVEPASIEPVTRRSADDLVLATALAGQAEVIVTGDNELLAIGTHESIAIKSPRSFIERRAKST